MIITDEHAWYEKVKQTSILKPYYCVYCGEEFQTKSSLENHSSANQILFSVRKSEVKYWFHKGMAFFKLKEYQKTVYCFKKVIAINLRICVAKYLLKMLKSY